MTLPTIIAFSWGPEQFHEAAEKLRARCETLGLPHRIHVRANLASHFRKCPGQPWARKRWVYRYIPALILQEMKSGEDLLYLHADYSIRNRFGPEAFEGLDIGLQERWAWRPDAAMAALAAPVFVRNNQRARRFVRHWYSRCFNVDDAGGEHGPLWETWNLFRKIDRSLTADWFRVTLASQAADADCPIVGHKRERNR